MDLRSIERARLAEFIDEGRADSPDPKVWAKAFKWRVGLYEMLEFDDEIRAMLLQWEKALEVEKYALEEKWMVNLERDAVFKMIQGQLPIEEVYRLVKHKKYV
jgi:type II secretory ATPase GspE/PulE/Tfp pilus assembly ATPase PilB-like protein